MQSEYLRQFLHLLFGSAIIIVLVFFGKTAALYSTAASFMAAVLLSFLIIKGVKIPFIEKLIENAKRENEKKIPLRGPIMFLTGIILAMIISQSFFAALGAISILVFGDGFSTLVGKKWGRIKISETHTLEGTLGGIIVSSIVLASFLDTFTAVFASGIAMLSELLGLEDNITIPVAGAIILSLIL